MIIMFYWELPFPIYVQILKDIVITSGQLICFISLLLQKRRIGNVPTYLVNLLLFFFNSVFIYLMNVNAYS